jgi:hypothetical protein
MMTIAQLNGLHVFPCRFDKTPAIARGFKAASNDPKVIDLWSRRFPLWGAPTGAINGFDILDLDVDGGLAWLVEYEATHGLAPTRIHATRSGGLHIFFRHRVGMRCSAGLIAPGVDVRSTGGYCILWHLAGCRVLSSAPIADWPGPMLELLDEAEQERTAENPFGGTLMVWQPSQADYEIPKPLYLKVCKLMAPNSSLRDKRRVLGLLRILVQKAENRNHALNTIGFAFRELISAGVIARPLSKVC